jgi:fermentation-respiration switch protein FrsA (DUF1100 family)
VTYAVGTHGFADRCAPSYELAMGSDIELELIYLAANGAVPPELAFTRNPLDYAPLIQKLSDNSLGSQVPDMPILVSHALTDELVPFGPVRDLFDEYCANGARAELVTAPGEHAETGYALAPVVIGWLADRFAGRTAPDTCS